MCPTVGVDAVDVITAPRNHGSLTPSVTDAPARVAAILAGHRAPSDRGVIPIEVADAVIATEESRFYSDPALDPAGVARATWGLITDNSNEGGATLEVQLAKLLYTPGRGLAVVDQVGLAFKLDARYTKAQILATYLDAAYFGDGGLRDHRRGLPILRTAERVKPFETNGQDFF